MIMNYLSLLICLVLIGEISYQYLRKEVVFRNPWYAPLLAMLLVLILAGLGIRLNLRYGIQSYSLKCLYIIVVLYLLTIIDMKSRVLPMNILLIGIVPGFLLNLFDPNIHFLDVLLSPLVYWVVLGGMSKLLRGGFGMGDVYVFVGISFLLGWKLTLFILIVALLMSGLLGCVLLITKRANRKTMVPFLPFLLIATCIVIGL